MGDMFSREHILSAFSAAAPIMLGYVAIGLPCGILSNTIGLNPLQVFLLCALLYSGAGQFMICNMFLAGSSIGSVDRALLVNLFSQSSWTLSNVVGCAVGAAVAIPVNIAAFAMTAIFICLLVTQKFTSANVIAMAVAALGVYVCKVAGLSGPAILIGAVAGVACAMAFALTVGKGKGSAALADPAVPAAAPAEAAPKAPAGTPDAAGEPAAPETPEGGERL